MPLRRAPLCISQYNAARPGVNRSGNNSCRLPLPEEDSRKPLDGVLNVLRGAHLPVEIFLLLAGEKGRAPRDLISSWGHPG